MNPRTDPLETELSAPPELLLAALTESMRAQREIIALLRELKLEVAELRDASADELMAIELREPVLAEPSLEQIHDTDGRTVQAPDDARDPPEATCDDPALPTSENSRERRWLADSHREDRRRESLCGARVGVYLGG